MVGSPLVVSLSLMRKHSIYKMAVCQFTKLPVVEPLAKIHK